MVSEGRRDPEEFDGLFAWLEGWLVCGLEVGCHLPVCSSILCPRTGGLVWVGQERRWVPGLGASGGVLAGVWLDQQDVPQAHMGDATWVEP